MHETQPRTDDNSPPLLLLGGSFNPPHRAHFSLAHHALHALNAQQCQLIPSSQPWQKPHVLPVHHRLNMLQAALIEDKINWQHTQHNQPSQTNPTKSNYPIHINPIETQLEHPSYTLHTLHHMQAQNTPTTPIIWLIGSDQLANFHTWHRWPEILECAHLAVVQRAGHAINPKYITDPTLRHYYTQHHCLANQHDWHTHTHGLFIEFQAPKMPVSSTQIRAQIAQNTPTPDLHTSVRHYIDEHQLYRTQP